MEQYQHLFGKDFMMMNEDDFEGHSNVCTCGKHQTKPPIKHDITKISDLTKDELLNIIAIARDLKAKPAKQATSLSGKTMLMFFEKPSLRTRVSCEVAMTQLGGHGIYYDVSTGPLGSKETIEDTAKCSSRFADFIGARVKSRKQISALAENSRCSVINLLDDYAHPCQMLADFLTISEKKLGNSNIGFESLKMVYTGDIKNNVTQDIMRACALLGMDLKVTGPNMEGFRIEQSVWDEVNQLCKSSGAKVIQNENAEEAVKGVDVLYTDSWMSQGIPKEEEEKRKKIFLPQQVNLKLLSLAKNDVTFMNCLPADRKAEQTPEVIDGPHSVVFDQAENRLHSAKALFLYLMNPGFFEQRLKKLGKEGKEEKHKEMKEKDSEEDEDDEEEEEEESSEEEEKKKQPKHEKEPHKPKKIMIALGGNALAQAKQEHTFENMIKNAKNTAHQIYELIAEGYEVSLAHGNGPQVGSILIQNEAGVSKGIPSMPMDVCGAESQGLIGYMIQQSLGNLLRNSDRPDLRKKEVVTFVTQVLLDGPDKDSSWQNPSKPVGPYYQKEQAEKLKAEGKVLKEDKARGGWRVVVPSPYPKKIIEIEAIREVAKKGHIVIGVGGGGIPVLLKNNEIVGCDAVIDKDRASELMAEELGVDIFIILTDVPYAYTNWENEPKRQRLEKMTLKEAKMHMEKGEFGKGSMEPKIESLVRFVERTGKEAMLTSLTTVKDALEGKVGTRIVKD